MPKHRAAATPRSGGTAAAVRPQTSSAPRHAAHRGRGTARRTVRNAAVLSGLAVAATGVAVAAGVVSAPTGGVDLAGSLTPDAAAAAPASITATLLHRTQEVSRSEDRRTAARPAVPSARKQHTDQRARRDPAKLAALGLDEGPAVSGRETVTLSDPQSIAASLLPKFGFSTSQMSCLVPLWAGESGWRVNAENVSSGAYGIPQALPGSKMGTAGADWRTNPVTQISWGLGYIAARYGSPCGAWSFKQGHGWY